MTDRDRINAAIDRDRAEQAALRAELAPETQINAAISLLRARGYSVTLPQADEWITVIDLWRKEGDGCSLAQFRERLHHSRCPNFQRHVGASGRMTTLRPTPELLAFLRQPSQPGKRLK